MPILVQETHDVLVQLLLRELEEKTLLARTRFALGAIALLLLAAGNVGMTLFCVYG